ncbi:hypothetical protein JEQ12_002490 [Ovis aries]|uniref:Uncharacterized protein n=1 Tax=Ovis aries TaxID=9940 RepID=A0A835ZVJ3_SHEEP|nr:hypothetical protein JEQ12_002490 [Ovis aries]
MRSTPSAALIYWQPVMRSTPAPPAAVISPPGPADIVSSSPLLLPSPSRHAPVPPEAYPPAVGYPRAGLPLKLSQLGDRHLSTWNLDSSSAKHPPLNVAIALPILQVEKPPRRGQDTCPESESPKLERSGAIRTWWPPSRQLKGPRRNYRELLVYPSRSSVYKISVPWYQWLQAASDGDPGLLGKLIFLAARTSKSHSKAKIIYLESRQNQELLLPVGLTKPLVFPRLRGALLKVKVKVIFTSYMALPTHDLSCTLVTLRPDSQSCGFHGPEKEKREEVWVRSSVSQGFQQGGMQMCTFAEREQEPEKQEGASLRWVSSAPLKTPAGLRPTCGAEGARMLLLGPPIEESLAADGGGSPGQWEQERPMGRLWDLYGSERAEFPRTSPCPTELGPQREEDKMLCGLVPCAHMRSEKPAANSLYCLKPLRGAIV